VHRKYESRRSSLFGEYLSRYGCALSFLLTVSEPRQRLQKVRLDAAIGAVVERARAAARTEEAATARDLERDDHIDAPDLLAAVGAEGAFGFLAQILHS